MSGYVIPIIVEKISTPKNILFNEIKDSLESALIFLDDSNIFRLEANRPKDTNRITAIKASKYIPLWGSFAKECMLSIIPDLTINAPNKLKEKTIIESNNVHILNTFDFEATLKECRKAVAASHGINATFSTGSQNQ